MRLSHYREDLPPQRNPNFRHSSSHSLNFYSSEHLGPSYVPPGIFDYHINYSGFSRPVCPESYNDLVKPSPQRLGKETPDCSKVIFTGERNFHHLPPKCKRKKKNRFLKGPLRKKSVLEKWEKVETHSDQFLDEKKHKLFRPSKKKDLSDGGGLDYETFKKDLPNINSVFNEYTEFYDKEMDMEENISEKLDNFVSYYEMLTDEKPVLDYNAMRKLIIQFMYNKVSIMSHLKKLMQPASSDFERYICTIGGIHGKKGRVINLPRCPSNQEIESNSVDHSEELESLRFSDHNIFLNDSEFMNPDDANNASSDHFAIQPCLEFCNESKSLEVGGRRGHWKSIQEGGITWNGNCSPVITQLSSSAQLDYFNENRVQVHNIIDSGGCIDNAHSCSSDCEMPCKASGIPVYQGRTGQNKKGNFINSSCRLEVSKNSGEFCNGNKEPPVQSSSPRSNAVSSVQVTPKRSNRPIVRGIARTLTPDVPNNESKRVVASNSPLVGTSSINLNSKPPTSRLNKKANNESTYNIKNESPAKKTKKTSPRQRINSTTSSVELNRNKNPLTSPVNNVEPKRSNSVPMQRRQRDRSTPRSLDTINQRIEDKRYKSNSSLSRDKANVKNETNKLNRSPTAGKLYSSKPNLNKSFDRLPRGRVIKSNDSNIPKSSNSLPLRNDVTSKSVSQKATSGSKIGNDATQNSYAETLSSQFGHRKQNKSNNNLESPNGSGRNLTFDTTLNKTKKASNVKENHRSTGSKGEKAADLDRRGSEKSEYSKRGSTLSEPEDPPTSRPLQGKSDQGTEINRSEKLSTISDDKNEGKNMKNKLIDNLVNDLKTEITKQNNNINLLGKIDSSRLLKVIDASLLNNIMINDEMLANQYHAIVSTLKKVSESIDMSWQKSENNESKISIEDQENDLFSKKWSEFRRSLSLNSYSNVKDGGSNSSENLSRKLSTQSGILNNRNGKLNLEKSSVSKKTVCAINSELIKNSSVKTVNQNNRFSSNLTKSQELLDSLEKEYKLLKGDEIVLDPCAPPLLNFETKSLARKFDHIFLPADDYNKINSHFIESKFSKISQVKNVEFKNKSDILNPPPENLKYKVMNGKKMRRQMMRPLNCLSSSDMEMHQRCSSLPKSFLSHRINERAAMESPSI